MTKSYHINESAKAINYFDSYSKEFVLFVVIFGVEVEVYYSSIKHHKLKRRVELKERKTSDILKDHFGQFYKLTNDDSQLHTVAMV